MAARRLSPLADDERAEMGAGALSADRLSGPLLLRRAENAPRGRSRSTRSIPSCWRPTRSSAFRCASRNCWPACRDAQVAVDAVFDSVSVATTFKEKLTKAGVIFCPISEAMRPSRSGEEISRHGRAGDRQFLRHAEFGGVFRRLLRLCAAGRALPDGAVDLFPHQRDEHRPVRAHADHRRQGLLRLLSRRLHRAQARREPAARRGGRAGRARRRRDQIFHGAELVSRRREGKGGIYNFVTKRGDCRGARSKISWTQVETGSAITWKYPSCILRGDDSRGEFYSIAISNDFQQADTGTKMIHLGTNTSSRIISKGITAGKSQNTYRGQVSAHRKADQRAQFHQVRLAADRRRMRRPYRALYRERRTPRARSSMRRRRRRSPTTSCSIACSAGFRRKRRWR